MNRMVNIGGSKLGRLTSNGFGKVRAVLRAKPRDSAGVDTSDSRDVMSRVACIQEREDVFSSSRGQGAHLGCWGYFMPREAWYVCRRVVDHVILWIGSNQSKWSSLT